MWAQIGQRQCDAYPHRRQTSADEAGMSIFTAVSRFKPQLFCRPFCLVLYSSVPNRRHAVIVDTANVKRAP